MTLNNIGLVYNSLGDKQKALDFYSQALPLHRAVGDRNGEAHAQQHRPGLLFAGREAEGARFLTLRRCRFCAQSVIAVEKQ